MDWQVARRPSGIGFVAFGEIGRLDVRAPILTTGPGARGFNLYDGSLQAAAAIAGSAPGSERHHFDHSAASPPTKTRRCWG